MSLDGVRVVEVAGSVAGAWTGKLFAGLGADVTKLVPATDDPLHALGLPWKDGSTMSAYLDTAKHVVRGGETEADALDALAELVADADVVIESSAPDPLRRRAEGMGGSGLIEVLISPFGLTGPHAGYRSTSLTDEAWSGHALLSGDPEREPLAGPGHQSDYAAGTLGFVGAMAALLARRRTGLGQSVEVSSIEAMVALHQFTFVKYTHGGQVLRRLGNRYAGPGHPIGSYECADGWVSISAPTGVMARAVLHATGNADLIENRTIADLMVDGIEIDARVRPWMQERTADEVVRTLQAARVPIAPNLTMLQLLEDEHFAARNLWSDVEGLRHPGPPFRIGRSPWTSRPTRRDGAPSSSADAVAAADISVAVPAGALDGLRVLDLTKVWAGPLAARTLAELGADVVMVEAPMARGPKRMPAALARSMALFPDNEPGERPWNRNGFQNEYARNKRSVTLDLGDDAGRQVLEGLVAGADVLMENYSARVMPSFGLDEHRLGQLNPSLVYVTMPGYGRTGPCRDWLAYGNVIDGHGGMTSLTGYTDEQPWKSGVAWPDAVAGLHAAAATLVALWSRALDPERRGDTIEVAQVETVIATLGHELLEAQVRGADRSPRGNRHPLYAPQGVYSAHGDDRWVAVSVLDDAGWQALCDVAGFEAEVRALTVDGRRQRHDELDQLIDAFCGSREPHEVTAVLQGCGVAAAPLLDAPGVLEDPHLVARSFFVAVDHPDAGTHLCNRSPLRLSRTPTLAPERAPLLGEHVAEVLVDEGVVTTDELDELVRRKVVVTVPPK